MNTYKLIISTPDGSVFDDEAISLIVRGTEGELAIMAGHIPFITAVKPCECKVTLADESEKSASIGGGIITVQKNITTLLCSDFNWN
ncbi:MAG: hypothetical protein IJN56_02240 [Clostridia bacterium]|nr:hypothetical protein [Clostridia bacterium]